MGGVREGSHQCWMPRPSVFSSRPISPVEETAAGEREARRWMSTTSKGAEPRLQSVATEKKGGARTRAHTLKLNIRWPRLTL